MYENLLSMQYDKLKLSSEKNEKNTTINQFDYRVI